MTENNQSQQRMARSRMPIYDEPSSSNGQFKRSSATDAKLALPDTLADRMGNRWPTTGFVESFASKIFQYRSAFFDSWYQFVSRSNIYSSTVIDRWLQIETSIENSFKNDILAPSEPLLPSVIYILVAGFSGALIARNRFAVTRWITALGCSLVACKVLLPKSSDNAMLLFARQLDKYPETAYLRSSVASKILAARHAIDNSAVRIQQLTDPGKKQSGSK